ncbi:MAG: ATP-binding protein [Actinomycetota bacterium]
MACGQPLAPDSVTPAEARKTVTVLFADIADSTTLGEQLDPESFRSLVGRYFEAVHAVIARHGGTVEKFAGDAVMAIFGIPVVHEDDALRAVRAAAEINDAIETLNDEIEPTFGIRLAIRTGVNTGEVVAGDRRALQAIVTGDAVNLAAKLEEVASAGRILMGASTYRLVKDAVRVEPASEIVLRGAKRAISAFELREVIGGAPGRARRLESPLVGRVDELRALMDAFDSACTDKNCHLVTVVAPAGVGKTRLVTEAVGRIAESTTISQGRCLPYGEGITFWPLAEAVKQAAGISDDDAPQDIVAKLGARLDPSEDPALVTGPLAQMIGLTDVQAGTGEIFWAARTFFESLARARPLVVVFDDIHRAEPTFLELVEHIVDWSRQAPILVVCMARPELFDEHEKWGAGRSNATTIVLESLSDAECDRLIENILGARLDDELRGRILEVAEGTPLFVEEVVAMLVEDQLLRSEDGRWVPTEDLSEVHVPTSIHALLAARVDRLEDSEREVLERAAVIGKVFYRDALARLASKETQPHLDHALETLAAKELIRPDADFAGARSYQFRHILILDAAYRAIPKEVRGRLHEQFAGWLEWNPGLRFGEYEEIVGYHLERAYGYLRDLGRIDDHALTLANGASTRLASAGRRALSRGDLPAAAKLLERAAALLPQDAPERLELLLDLARSLIMLGEGRRFETALDEVADRAAAQDDKRAAARARIERYQIRTVTEDERVWKDEARRDAEAAIPIFKRHGDELGLARTYQLLAECYWYESRIAQAEPYLERALIHARRAQNALEETGNIVALSTAKLVGPTPVDEAIAWCERALAEGAKGNRWLQASVRLRLAELTAVRGDFDEARMLATEASSELQELGLSQSLLAASEICGDIEILAGNPAGAEQQFRRAFELSKKIDEPISVAQFAGHLALAMCELGRYEEAEELLDASAAIGSTVLETAIWRATRARVLARRGEFDEALAAAQLSVQEFSETDGWWFRGWALMSLGEVLALAGKERAALEPLAEAMRMCEHKGVAPWIEKMRTLRGELSSSTG